MSRLKHYLVPFLLTFFALAFAGTASAQKVANPGTFNFKLTSGVMKVKDQEFGFDETQNINFNGTVDKAGNISIPSITFPEYPISASGFNLTVKINVVGPTTGTINPLNGAVSLRLRVWIKIDGVPLGGDCRIASSSSPIDVNALITGTSGSRTGTLYNPADGTVRLVNSTYGVPSSSSCGIAAGTVDSTVGLPSPAGQNGAEFNLKAVPNINRAIVPALTATPTSGTAPLPVTLNAGGSTLSAGPATYRWDFTNDGTIDQTTSTPTVSHTYTVGGAQTARVQVVDSEGDTADATRQLTINAYPDLSITAAHDADFRVGSPGAYRVNVKNEGYAATSGPVSVTSTLPAGLSYTGTTGSGWSCTASGQDLSCTRGAAVAPGADAPELGVILGVGNAARGAIEPVFTVATSGDNGPGNNSASDPTDVRATDLKVSVGHASHAMLLGADPANLLDLTVENVGDAATVGPTVLVDELPAGLAPLSATGTDWTCEIEGQKVTCTYPASIPAGAVRSVEVAVSAALEPGLLGTTVTHGASVTTADDFDADNNQATEPVLILDGQDIGIAKSHSGDFTAGQTETYELKVTNKGTKPTEGPVTLTDDLPASLGFVSADGGPDWTCDEEDGTVSCLYNQILAPGEVAPTINLTVSVSSAAIPAVTNTAQVSTAGDPNPANDSSTDHAVVQAIDMTVTKTHEGPVRVGGQAVYTLAVKNVGDSISTGPVTLTDVLPAGLGYVSADGGAAWECTEAGGTVTCEHDGLLGPNQNADDVTLTTSVGIAAAPEVTNSVEVATQDDFNLTNNQAFDEATVIDVDTSASISRTGTFRPGQTGTYMIVVSNEGAVPTANPTGVSVEVPAGLTFNSVSGNGWVCSEASGLVECERPAGLGAHSTAPAISLRVNVTPAAVPGVQTTAVAATEGDRYPDNDSDTDSAAIVAPDLEVTSTHEGNFRIGQPSSYSIEVSNQGNGPTVGQITLTDTLPAGITAQSAYGPAWSCSIAGQDVTCERSAILAAGADTGQLTIEVTPTPSALPSGQVSATVDNEVAVSTAVDSDSSNDTAIDPTDLIAVDASIGMEGPAAVPAGGVAEFPVTVVNLGSASVNGGVRVVNTLPAGFVPRNSSGTDWTCASSGRRVTCDYSRPVPAGGELPGLTVRGRAGSDLAGTVTNQAEVLTDGDVIASNDSADFTSEVTSAPDLEVGIKALTSGNRLQVGTENTYRVTVANRGTASTTGPVSVRVAVPSGMSYLGVEGESGWSCTPGGSTVDCVHTGPLAAGSLSTFDLRVTLVASVPDGVSVSAAVESDDDGNPENDDAIALNEVARLDLALSRSHSNEWIRGSAATYLLKVSNLGNSATTGPVTITETLPQGTNYVSSAGEGWTCQVSKRTLTCVNVNVIQGGESSELTVTLDLGASTSSLIEASSRVSTIGDANQANDVAGEQIQVSDPPRPNRSGPVQIRTSKLTPTAEGTATVWLACPQSSAIRCQGTLSLATKGKVKIDRKKKARLALGKSDYSVAPGRQMPVRVKFTKRARKALKSNKKFQAVAKATNLGAGPSSAPVLIRRPR